ncbi:hypothetical protein WJX81_005489 [Elliptochloris bilobata]|uniref:JmjC domain-containing protein n=1 Tax=Elliptochloris bilobata TaxID=381761 RepID=A0AAW1QJJ5_9CHLO
MKTPRGQAKSRLVSNISVNVGPCNKYRGWHPPAGDACALDALSLSPEWFWRDHIAPRCPAIIRQPLTDLKAARHWTYEHLVTCAGAARVSVERRGVPSEGFGHGKKVQMAFGEFVRRAAAGDELLYLTTQQAAVGADGHAECVASPLAELCAAGDLPLRPALMGNLVPQQLNLWMGTTQTGASSGLHHDFHDNLYLLIRGRKRLRLYPPSALEGMYTHGRPRIVHPNGRIVYAGQGDVNADGSDAADVAAWKQRRAVDAAAVRAQPDAVEAALDAALDGFARRGADDDRRNDWDAMDDYQDSGTCSPSPAAACSSEQDDHPPSFSRIDLSLPPAQLRRKFPRFPGTSTALEVDLRAGEALYLPAGWFHEVTSFSIDAAPHMALNYWFHPPDNVDPGPQGFAAPYTSEFWPAVWAARRAHGPTSSCAGVML